MGRTRIKLCGLRTPDDALAAGDAGADAIGLVFVKASPRYVNVKQAAAVVRALPAFIEPVGLFVDTPVKQVMQIALELGLGTVQLHGQEGIEEVSQLSPMRVIKALSAGSDALDATVSRWSKAGGHLSALLWDAPATGGALTGGSGQCADWDRLAKVSQPEGLSMILAGGLTAQNVGQAMAVVRPYAVDVSSGVESQRGVKDAGKMAAFCEAVRVADALASL